jgi:uncharacterized protein with PIN domain
MTDKTFCDRCGKEIKQDYDKRQLTIYNQNSQKNDIEADLCPVCNTEIKIALKAAGLK